MASLQNILPQEGTSGTAGGESLPVASAAGCPAYSGGGKDCFSNTTTQARIMETIARDLDSEVTRRPSLDGVKMKEARVRLERLPIAALSDTSEGKTRSDRMECDGGAASDSDCSLTVAAERGPISDAMAAMLGAKRPRLSEGSTDDERTASPGMARWRQQEKRAAAKARAKQKEEDLEKEAELARFRRETRSALFPRSDERTGERCAAQLQEQVQEDLAIIERVASKSSNLKGNFVRALKDAAVSIKEAVEVLGARTLSEETSQLQADNARLRAEMDALHKELAAIKEDLRKRGSAVSSHPDTTVKAVPASRPPQTPNETSSVEEICRAVMVQVGGMMNARLASLEDRLLPERNLRPPLAADKKRDGSSYAAKLAGQPTVPAKEKDQGAARQAAQKVPAQPGTSGTQRKAPAAPSQRPPGPAQSRPETQGTSAPSPATAEKGKSKRRRKRRKNKKKSSPPGQQQSQPAVGEWIKVGPKRRQKEKAGAAKLHAPRSSAVVITLQPGASERGATYASVIASAKERINPAELGAQGVRLRKAANGGRIFEFPGASSGEKADSLAQRLREVLDSEVVRVSRPTKSVALRVSGLDDSTTSAEVVAAIAAAGECPAEQLRAGVMSTGRDGLGSVVVQCPVAAAKKIVTAGRLLVGWVSAQARVLDARPMRCFRCLAPGHLSGQCQGVDRSGLCFRCGQPGHKARGCTAAPHCVVCAAAGMPAEHRVGNKACVSPPKGKRSKKGGGDGQNPTVGQPTASPLQAAAPQAEEVAMVVE
ncbi:uncharacterized protein LOC123723139 [Papilio machaon]|uniref:uncharacterized protein LOC123723027 n=1 Tax=Papilio machaon TaxID=76193 RepID=UPI001E663D42|nr:uncharacterized protein LOC123723027 [Papilio machaon]XP_045541619.1 uncharacterized protein LOC123723109 [Papilio machaon]XP_045541649.1 uncharacterized protein LOC123723139 [Papilio machaon]